MRQTIKRILREELSPRVRRRVPYDEMEREFLESFEDAYNFTKKRKISQINSLDELIYTTIHMMMDGIHWRFFSTLPKDEDWYEDIYTELENHYKDRITQMYNERQGINESILREEINPVLRKVMRRTAAIDWEIEFAVREVKRQNNVCFMGEDAFIETVIEKTIDSMYWNFFSDIDDNSKEWSSAYYFMEQYINDNFVDKLRQNYQLNCNKRVETNEAKSPKSKKVKCSKCGWSWKLSQGGHDPYTCHECGNVNSKSELTEKCWAGYTQKGMKTMFGKRYPNCVKKTKK